MKSGNAEGQGDRMSGYHIGDAVAARHPLQGFDMLVVPAGTVGTVATTTVFGNPKQVCFAVSDIWGVKRIHLRVHHGDVEATTAEPNDE